MSEYLVVIRVRGKAGVSKKVNDTLDMMRLYNQHGCVVIPKRATYLGMLKRAKDYITWGEISKETFLQLLQKRGRVAGNKPLTEEYIQTHLKKDMHTFVEDMYEEKHLLRDIPGVKPFFRLTPPLKGFERGGIKTPYSMGGVLGYRKDKINDLLVRMM